jgi:hypothetical protein
MAESQIIPWKRITIEAAAIVGSILLAFAIDARWDNHQDQEKEKEILEGLLVEFQSFEDMLDWDRTYYSAIRASALRLVDIGMGVEENASDQEIDQLLEEVWWWSLPTRWSTAELNSVIASGNLALVSNAALRQDLGEWAITFEEVVYTISEEKEFYRARFMPYMSKHVSLQQLLIVADGNPAFPSEDGDFGTAGQWGHPIKLAKKRAHREVLSQLEFQNLLVERASLLNDILHHAFGTLESGLVVPYLRTTIEQIEQELANQ